jgi:hypothetical protein
MILNAYPQTKILSGAVPFSAESDCNLNPWRFYGFGGLRPEGVFVP